MHALCARLFARVPSTGALAMTAMIRQDLVSPLLWHHLRVPDNFPEMPIDIFEIP